ncbi:hypothetical protein AUK04_04775 [Candidatus Roizmanbacteria bacterium CG2_30_33_16]|uniref:Transposase IS200-like domain-containing protein n=3 Tax=Candidatus Roizmaniibacteriota TaxID=1752723 RepID=A0A2M7LMN5_9BACT|nr:MAG: hypothetical protein AUK04_04775 [Candidatus Roizmanbacteria bacterium CG2_30_33_16]PIX69314.1 MAG: hypothetical protein COZ39_05475 [Candidatus Roizmanbacteria bacterium CG_4_10_14_3_um_filter_33_21]PIZ67789.1 MAG: hypothetical protein COY13_02475 [Candidatus Roizmanbacteria bacterium CG_4_10_14_0_2_um_filter_36_35]
MPLRSIFVNNYYYHIYNKTLDDLKPFEIEISSDYFINLINYYQYSDIKMSYSETLRLELDLKEQYFKHLRQSAKHKVEILAFCLMSNHFHLLLKQKQEGGISKFVGDVLNGFTRFCNIQNERKGPIFLPRFRSKPIMDEEHLIHVSRYIHLNPYVGGLINTVNDIWSYPLSSAHEYFSETIGIVNTEYILGLGYFLGNRRKYKMFVENETKHSKTRILTKYLFKWNN